MLGFTQDTVWTTWATPNAIGLPTLPTPLRRCSFTLSISEGNPRPAIWESTADFVDLHTYLGWGLSLEQYIERFGVDQQPAKPVILGEFGPASRAYPRAALLAQVLQEWQAASCQYGIDGWLLWTWDTYEQAELWNGMSENGEINAALAPVNRPDPCRSRAS